MGQERAVFDIFWGNAERIDVITAGSPARPRLAATT
jgi:hypothetical protein